MLNIRPLPSNHGVGFTSNQPVPEDLAKGYRYEQVGMHHNYHVTRDNWAWPDIYPKDNPHHIIDGFSPNLNKELHVGHLRNLAVALALQKIFNKKKKAEFVALLGASLGVKKVALDAWNKWTEFVGYKPKLYYDVLMPTDVVPCRQVEDATLVTEYGAWVWDGPCGPVIVKRSDGRPLYAHHDVAFSMEVGPTHYITGHEQAEHFKNLGFADKHLPMGLVLGDDGKKLKSRDGDALSAEEAMGMVVQKLETTPAPRELAWNVLAWNFLQCARQTNVKFEVEKWTNPDSPGLYITYTFARTRAALAGTNVIGLEEETTQEDVDLIGFANQHVFYTYRAEATFDPAPIANFSLDLARKISAAYHRERIQGGRDGFVWAVHHANWVLRQCLSWLGMKPLHTV